MPLCYKNAIAGRVASVCFCLILVIQELLLDFIILFLLSCLI